LTATAYSRPQLIGLVLGPLLFLATLLLFEPEGMSYEARMVLAVTLLVATWWITEAIPIPATSLVPIVLLPLTGAMSSGAVTSAYGDDIIFLFLGGFFIANAMEKWNLHRRIALRIIRFVGTSTQRILLGFMIATAFLSMWVSNTAAVMMMIPMALAITHQVTHAFAGQPEASEVPHFEKSLIFGVGYAGTIGGLGTLIGTPPNIVLAAQVQRLFNTEISFASWMMVGVPVVVVMVALTWVYLARFAFPTTMHGLPGGRDTIDRELATLGPMSFEEKAVGIVFATTAFFWVTRDFIWTTYLPEIRDGMIAVAATVVLFLIPSRSSGSPRVLVWKDSLSIPWGVLLLFGGGLAIAAGFKDTGLSSWVGLQFAALEGVSLLVLISSAALLVLFLTEITSNTATATMIMPIMAALAVQLEVHPYALMVACAMAANCAFMLPVGTPPNAIIFATERLRIIEMVRVGFLVNIISFVVIVGAVYFLIPLFWGIDLGVLPDAFRQPAP
jgi:sodium-dependent dicarboxylate transporter 2/3/5